MDTSGSIFDSGTLVIGANTSTTAFTFTVRASDLPSNTRLYAYATITSNKTGNLLSECTSSYFTVEEEEEVSGWSNWSSYGSYTSSANVYFSLSSGTIGYCRFTPSSAGTLVVYSSSSTDIYGWLTDGDCSLGSGNGSSALSGGTIYARNDDSGSSYGGGSRDFGYSYNVSAGTTYEIDFHAYSMDNSSSGYIYIEFTPSISSWQSPVQMASVSGTSYSSYSATTTIDAYRAGYVKFYAPNDGQIIFSHTSSNSLYSRIASSLFSAGSGTSFESAVDNSSEWWGTTSTDSTISQTVSAGNYYYWYVNGYWSSSGTYSIPWSLTYKRAYIITYNANGGSGTPSTGTYYVQSTPFLATLISTVPTRTGYTFLGWSTSSSATSASYSAGSTISLSGNVTLYAVWQEASYTISYNANAGSDTVKNIPSSQTKSYGTTLTLSSLVPLRYGYTFKGWATTSSATTAAYQPGASFTTNANTTLYAVWAINTYTVSFNANGGTGAPSSFTKTYGTVSTIPTTVPTRSGYTFLGWSTDSAANVVSYCPGDSYDIDLNITLYAVWSSDTVEEETGKRQVFFKKTGFPVHVYLGSVEQMVWLNWDTNE